MFVAKVTNGQIANTGKLADMYPNTSFPKSGPTDRWMTANDIQVIKSYRSYDRATHKLVTVTPYLDSGEVYDVQVQALTDAEKATNTSDETARKEAAVRKQRDALLAETDFYALSDVTMSAAMTTYRQALRDITSHANFPDLSNGDMDGNNSDWPVKP